MDFGFLNNIKPFEKSDDGDDLNLFHILGIEDKEVWREERSIYC